MYNDIVLDHLSDPRNAGDIYNPDGIGQVGNPVDGDNIKIYISVENDIIYDIKFKTFGCGAAIAASSMVTVMAMGKNINDVMTIKNQDVARALGGLPDNKLQCSNIAADALHNAILDYIKKKKEK